jgi:ABC-type Mn2+/Zn2+ transport system ATPase subunit
MEGQVLRKREQLRFGYLPQHRNLDHTWPMSGLDAATMAVSAQTPLGRVGRVRAQILEAMRTLAVDDLAIRSFSGLSGGQQQRLLLAGAVACKPDILVLDEPTEGLDVRSRKNLLGFLRGTLATGLCTVIISHDVQDILQACDQVAWLHPGEEIDEPSTVEMITPNDLADRVTKLRQAS